MNELSPIPGLVRDATDGTGTEPDDLGSGDNIGDTFPEPTVQPGGDSTAGGNISPIVDDAGFESDVIGDAPPVGPSRVVWFPV